MRMLDIQQMESKSQLLEMRFEIQKKLELEAIERDLKEQVEDKNFLHFVFY